MRNKSPALSTSHGYRPHSLDRLDQQTHSVTQPFILSSLFTNGALPVSVSIITSTHTQT